MTKYTLLGTALAAMLLIPTLAMAEDASTETTMEHPAKEHEMMGKMKHDGEEMRKKMDGGFEEADTNKDGVLSEEEFLNRHKKKFAEIDADKNGSLSKVEMKAHGEAYHEKMKERREERRDERKEKHDDKEMMDDSAE